MKCIPVLVLVCTAVLLSGCGKAKKSISEKIAEKVAEKAMAMSIKGSQGEDAKVDIADGKVNIKTKDGETTYSVGEGASIPADFPKDVCVFKDATIQMAMKVPDGFMLNLKVSQPTAKLAETFEAEMKAQGWEQEGSFDMGGSKSLTYKKGEERQATVIMSKSEDATDVMLTVVEKKQETR